jgi:uncharacterized membrane protein YhaH (DUF805 family)/predicted RNA-binding Zn-ribbon protein involved in translation (DUF1610 family)
MDSHEYKFCPNCGTQLTEEGIQFCPHCGTKLSDRAHQAMPNRQSDDTSRLQYHTSLSTDSGQTDADTSAITDRIKKELFSYHGRLNRLAYFKRGLIVAACGALSGLLGAIVEEISSVKFGELVFYMGLIPCLVSSFMLGIRRCHDFNKPGWFFCLTCIPFVGGFVGLYILLAAGTKGENQYGPDPLANKY